MDLQLHTFLTSALNGDCSAPCLRKIAVGVRQIGSWVGPRARVDVVGKATVS
jgi:hypothetical protein